MPEQGPASFLTCTVSTDPLADRRVGASFRVEPVVFGSSNARDVPDGVTNWDFFQGAVVAIGVSRGSTSIDIVGTGVMIAPAVAVTATHVLRDDLAAIARANASVFCIGVRTGHLDLWKLRSVSYAEADDIAYLSLELASVIPDDWRFTTLPVTTRCPVVGERLTILGFRFAEAPGLSDGNVIAGGDLFAAAGEVLAAHAPLRDKVLMPFPTIEIACGSLHGMSGGAVLDRNGALMGVISRSWKFEDATGAGPTSVAWVIGALARRLDLPWPPGLYADKVEIMAIPERLLHIIGRDAVSVTEARTDYREWFGP